MSSPASSRPWRSRGERALIAGVIYPTPRAVILMALGAPVALLLSLAAPAMWPASLGWVLLVAGLAALDARLSPARRTANVSVRAPASLGVGANPETLAVALRFPRGTHSGIEVAPEVNGRLALAPTRTRLAGGAEASAAQFALSALRRGEGRLERVWVRWKGPLGLAYKQVTRTMGQVVDVTPDFVGLRQTAIRLFDASAPLGAKIQDQRGGGEQYESLREFGPGMDRRAIDWKRSAHHGALMAKEFRAEINHTIVLVMDTGRLMCEPLAGVPRIDRALNAALLLAYVSLKLGDRVGLFAFDSRPRLETGAVTGAKAFPSLQRLVANLDYSSEETNFTLGLTTLQGRLERRSLIVVFTEFVDAISAELMLENTRRLVQRHFMLFVVFRDQELENAARAAPETPDDISKAVVAGILLRQREGVLSRLRRMGVEIVETSPEGLSTALIDVYLSLKRGRRL